MHVFIGEKLLWKQCIKAVLKKAKMESVTSDSTLKHHCALEIQHLLTLVILGARLRRAN